ncbi:DNA double-strand break repair Rad50 ATPase [Faustovirus]|nr:DNA double-strand break repair Rad50 ATPase [Faustovirus]AMN84444.1 DNA double-strand break repair Rad50 ATPase [Faustovirus]AMP44414.1 DNA double-strand break repair Rad50 ATPase [Faustovirus]
MENIKVVNVNTVEHIEYIIHVADIHIGSSNIALSYDRREEYKRVFAELRKLIDTPLIKGKCMVVIAGDIFHNKNRVSASCILLFNHLMNLLRDTPVLIIPGNHDVVENNHGYSCLIAPLLERDGDAQIWPNVYYSRDTELIHMCGLEFLHVSIYDPRKRGELEALTEAAHKAYPNYTLLYHGVVDGIKFGTHVENDTRVSKKTLQNCRRAILGDIHEHCAPAPHCVYSGSMIQQNRGESRNKGVVIWNIPGNNYLFKRLANPAGFLTIDLRPLGDPMGAGYRERLTAMLLALKAAHDPDFEQTYAVTVITDTYNNDGLFVPEIMNIVGREISAIKRIQADDVATCVDDANAGVNTTLQDTPEAKPMPIVKSFEEQLPKNLNKDNHRVILEDLLLSRPGDATAKGKLSREMFEYVWDIHAASEIVHKRVRWTIYKLRFSNLFKYGENNVIDFRNMRGVCGVIANNRMGKSSILDVIVLALFNKTLRANRGDAINSHANSASITIKFVVNGVMWRLRKEFDRHKQTVKLHRREMAPKADDDPTLVPKWVDATCVDANETYDKVRREIGDLREFLATCMQVQESYTDDIIRMKNTDRKKILSGLLGLDQLKGVADNARARLTELTKEVAKITTDMPNEVSADQIKSLQDEICDIKQQINTQRGKLDDTMRESKEASVRLTSYNQIKELHAKIAKLTSDLAEREAELDKLNANMTALMANCAKYNITLTVINAANAAKHNVDTTPRTIVMAIDAAAAKFAANATNAVMPIGELAKRCRSVSAAKITALPTTLPTRDVATIEAELTDLIAQRGQNTKTNVELTDIIARCNTEISRLNAAIKATSAKKHQLVNTNSIQDRINAISSVYKFNDGCDDCKRNRSEYHKRVDMAALTTELEKALAVNAQYERDNVALNNLIESQNAQIAALMAESTNAGLQLGIRARISERTQELVIAREFGGLSALQATCVFKAREFLEQIEDGYNRLNYYITTRINGVKLEITQFMNYIAMYTEDLRMFAGNTDDINDIEAVIKHAEHMADVCSVMQRELIDKMHLLESKQAVLAKLERDVVLRAEAAAKLIPLNERITAVNEYIKSLDVKTGLPCRLMQESITALTARVNDLLREISDFSVKTRIDDDKIDFYVREKFADTSKSEVIKKHGLSVELASGYQKFVIMLAYRLSLAATLPCAADFVFIDEGFGCLDSANAAKIGELLHAVKANYRFMFIISHIDVLHMCLTTPIAIRTLQVPGERSHIVYGGYQETHDEDYIIGEPLPAEPLAQRNEGNNLIVGGILNNINAELANNAGANANVANNADANNVGAKIRCECGRLVNRGNLQRHRATPTHIAQLAARQNQQA